ncbi:MAG: glycoside hydrolase family 9 protein, partial [Calditrichota bacterium]
MVRYFIAGVIQFIRPIIIAILLAGILLQLKASDIVEVLPLTDKVIMLHFSDGYVIHYGYGEMSEDDSTVVSPLDSALAALASSYLISSGSDPNYTQGVQPTQIGRKSKGSDFSRDCQWNGSQCVNDIVFDHWIYLVLDEPMQTGNDYTIFFGALAENLDEVSFVYDEKNLRSEAVHVNQIGFLPDAQQKYAYVSHWLGELGDLPLDDYSGNTFWLINRANGSVAFQGSLNLRFRKNAVETGQTGETPNGNFTGADVWECDFSSFSTPGEYVVAVEGIGSSFPFRIGKDVYREVFTTTTRGLYHHRAGIEKGPPFTDWFLPADHRPDMGTIINYSTVRFMDQTTENGNENEVLGNITGTADSTWGWYHDAGDWDGYPNHFRVPQSLMLIYELAPENFVDGELNIPGSGNGVPDILDEAEWLVKYFERNIGPTGGIFGSRIHADFQGGNPDGVPSWEDTREWVVFGEEPRTSYNFAGIAANLAYCLRIAEEETGESFSARIDDLLTKSTSAWNWAENNLQSGDEVKVQTARNYAAAVLYKATGKTSYLARFIQTNLLQQGNYDNSLFLEQRWGGWNFALVPDSTTGLDFNLRSGIQNLLVEHADFENLLALDRRSFRFGGNFWMPMIVGQATTPWVIHSIMAYEVSGEQRFINAVQTTCDYFLGGNPLNMVWVSGIGERNPAELLHLDSWY